MIIIYYCCDIDGYSSVHLFLQTIPIIYLLHLIDFVVNFASTKYIVLLLHILL